MRRLSSGSRGASSFANGSASANTRGLRLNGSSASQQLTNLDQEEEQDGEFWYRGPTRVPTRPTREEDKPRLTPKRDK
uniref:Uncharacterized protein n=1 Tax=Oryza brachyantha TaxID=4533 RepID=J3ME75_ORYBR